MNLQVWVGNEEPAPDQIEPIENLDDRPMFNKPKGGLWTSSLREDTTSGWIEWMKRERWSNVQDPEAWVLTPADEIDVYTVDTVADLAEIAEQSDDPRFAHMRTGRTVIDFESVFEEYDAIHLTTKGQRATRFTAIDEPDLYGWDSECVLWDGWHFTDVDYAGEVEIPDGW